MESPTSPPNSEPYDPGSSVSSNMMEEYEDLLRYAVVTPSFSGSVLTPNLKATLSNRSATLKATTSAVPTTPTVTTRGTYSIPLVLLCMLVKRPIYMYAEK